MRSPDTRMGKWVLHSRWGKWDLKRLNRSGLPGNTAQQPSAHISTFSLFPHPPLCSPNTSVTVTCVNIILGSCSRTGASDMGSAALPPCYAPGAWCQAFHLWELMPMRCPLETKVARIILQEMLEIPLSMCHSPNTSLSHASAVRILLLQLHVTSYKHLKSKITSSDNSTLAVIKRQKAVNGRGHVSPPNELRMLQDF